MNYTKKFIKKTHYHLIDIKKIERNPNNSGVEYMKFSHFTMKEIINNVVGVYWRSFFSYAI